MKIVKPVVIVGTGRCGSTVFARMLSLHPHFTFLSSRCEKYPERPELNRRWIRALDSPLLRPFLKKRVTPSESYRFWRYYAIGGSYRDLREEDLTEAMKRRVTQVVDTFATAKRTRLLLKFTGWARIGFTRAIWPDARFIHILRDGRAVVNSMLEVPWWEGWRGPSSWGWGDLSPEELDEWKRHGESFTALAAINWRRVVESIERSRADIPASDFMEIRYRDLCRDVEGTFRKVLEFAELPRLPEFRHDLENFRLSDNNFKWKRDLTAGQRKILSACLDESLERLGFPLREE
jgi:hypothetical protein